MPHVAEYSPENFPRALSSPFDGLFPVHLSAPWTLWKGMTAVISASMV